MDDHAEYIEDAEYLLLGSRRRPDGRTGYILYTYKYIYDYCWWWWLLYWLCHIALRHPDGRQGLRGGEVVWGYQRSIAFFFYLEAQGTKKFH